MITINLLPEKYYKARKLKQLLAILIVGGSVIVAVLIFLYFIQVKNVAKLNKQIKEVEVEQEKYRPILEKMEMIKNKEAFLQSRMKVLKELTTKHSVWPRLLDDLNRVVPFNIWLTKVDSKAQAKGRIFTIDGISLSKEGVADFMTNLQKSTYFENVVLLSLAESFVSGMSQVSFRITCSSKI
ncbi:MAG: PilN domain-containing protein [Candidatus Firestonebacteria bacterium]